MKLVCDYESQAHEAEHDADSEKCISSSRPGTIGVNTKSPEGCQLQKQRFPRIRCSHEKDAQQSENDANRVGAKSLHSVRDSKINDE